MADRYGFEWNETEGCIVFTHPSKEKYMVFDQFVDEANELTAKVEALEEPPTND